MGTWTFRNRPLPRAQGQSWAGPNRRFHEHLYYSIYARRCRKLSWGFFGDDAQEKSARKLRKYC